MNYESFKNDCSKLNVSHRWKNGKITLIMKRIIKVMMKIFIEYVCNKYEYDKQKINE